MGVALPILGAAVATGMVAMGASCGTIALAGTLVSTKLGRKRIDEIEKGDEV